MTINTILLKCIFTAYKAGDAILEVYETDFDVELKKDQSPLTLADRRSNSIITEALKTTGIPVLSEEGRSIPYEERSAWEKMWLIDPLDGTKEFVKRNGEFTVNIALIDKGRPVMGVVYSPVLELMYFGAEGLGASRIQGREWYESYGEKPDYKDEDWEILLRSSQKLPLAEKSANSNEKSGAQDCPIRVVASRSHMSDETSSYIARIKEAMGNTETVNSGSSLKLCRIAEGSAHVYPRFAPTMEWDTGAGQAVVECSGAYLVRTDTMKSLEYNRQDLVNPWFLAARNEKFMDFIKDEQQSDLG